MITLTCPRCGKSGRTDGREPRFDICGRNNLDLVCKCLSCRTGLQIEITPDMTFGKPEVIPDRKWFDMEALRGQQFDQSDIQEDERLELGQMLHSMFGFVHGYTRLLVEIETYGNSSPEISYHLNALRIMCVNYFIGTSRSPSDVNVRNILAKHGLSDLLDPIDGVLGTALGTTDFRSILTRFRNKYLTHELFQLRPLERIYDDFDLRDEKNWIKYIECENHLFDNTVTLFYDLRDRFPTAWMIVGDANP